VGRPENEPDLDPDYLREIRDENKRLEKEDRAMEEKP